MTASRKSGLRQLMREDMAIWAMRSGREPGFGFWLRHLLLRPGFHFVVCQRTAQALSRVPIVGLPAANLVAALTRLLFASRIGLTTRIAGGLYTPHPFGIEIDEGVAIGAGVTVLQNTILGSESAGAPVIGDGVYLGAGCRVSGPVVLGARATVGANADIRCDVPQGAIAVGRPARLILSEA